MSVTAKSQSIWDKFWKNNDSVADVIIWQKPNLLLISWAILTVVSLILNGTLATIILWLSLIALLGWSILEVLKEANYFRKTLGVVVLFLTIVFIIHYL
jgi:hypothetical protein